MNSATQSAVVGIYSDKTIVSDRAQNLSEQLNLPILKTHPSNLDPDQFCLFIQKDHSLALCFTGRSVPGPIQVDFLSGAAAHRRQFGGGKGQLIAKAVGLKTRFRPHVVDLTAGLGGDAFVLATLGCKLTMVERVDVVFQLLLDGINRARESEDHILQDIVNNINCINQQALTFLSENYMEPLKADVIYLDPMFPERDKSAKVKKSMSAFHNIVGEDNDAGELLSLALDCAKYRVVIKRPRKALSISEQYPSLALPKAGLVLEGKSSRYDIYPIAKMPEQ